MNIAAIASGSNGNCYYIEHEHSAILIDAGISCKQIVLRMQNLKIDPEKIKAIFVTHEHTDHIRGIEVLSKTFSIPVYVTKGTFDNSNFRVKEDLLHFIEADSCHHIDGFVVNAFSKPHDAAEPCSYTIEHEGKTVSVVTDIGEQCDSVIDAIKQSDALFLETNYDLAMLNTGNYPPHLKQRISGGMGHLSNNQAGALLVTHAKRDLQYVFLSHLSGNNNSPKRAYETVKQLISLRADLNVEPVVAKRDCESSLVSLR